MKYLKLTFKAKNENFEYPFFIGSTLRGAFGYALKRVVCINPSYKCEGCFSKDECLYFDFYEKKNTFHKFRFDFLLNLKNLEFNLYLFDDIVDKLPYILMAVLKMLKENGLGKNRDKFEILEVKCNNKSIFNGENFNLKECDEKNIEFSKDFFPNIKLKFITPIRIKENNRFATKSIKLETILKSINYRFAELQNLESNRLDFKPEYKTTLKNISFIDFQRYSNRQERKMNIGGIVGEIEYYNLDRESYQLLKIGEIIGVGKSTVFGLGKIEVEKID